MPKEITQADIEILKVRHPELYEKLQPARGVNNRWGKNTNPSYYSEHYAKEVQPVIDRLLETGGKTVLVAKEQFEGLALSSCRMKMTNGFYYLVDFMDVDGKYASIENMIKFQKNKTGILVSFSFAVLNPENDPTRIKQSQKPIKTLAASDAPSGASGYVTVKPEGWRGELEEFVDNPASPELDKSQLVLTAEDRVYAEELLSCIPMVEFTVGNTFIKARRTV